MRRILGPKINGQGSKETHPAPRDLSTTEYKLCRSHLVFWFVVFNLRYVIGDRLHIRGMKWHSCWCLVVQYERREPISFDQLQRKERWNMATALVRGLTILTRSIAFHRPDSHASLNCISRSMRMVLFDVEFASVAAISSALAFLIPNSFFSVCSSAGFQTRVIQMHLRIPSSEAEIAVRSEST
jgi:hypothetical protein